jgi:hypothetical protein
MNLEYIVGVTVDTYKEFTYQVPDRLGKHRKPYVGVVWKNSRVAWIDLADSEVYFYEETPKEVINNKPVLEEWIQKNKVAAKQAWNRAHTEIKI